MKKYSNYKLSFQMHKRNRITAAFLAAFMLFNICAPTIAVAAVLLSSEQISNDLGANFQFQPSNSHVYLYERASFLNATSAPPTQSINSLHKRLVAAKKGLPEPGFLPIVGDITIFIPHHSTGKLIGDEYVQNRYIREQIKDQLGRHLIGTSTYPDEITQINRLFDNAFTFAIQNNKGFVFGDNLPENLTIDLDMAWPERRLIDGQQVLVPIVYLRPDTIANRKVTNHLVEFGGSNNIFETITVNQAKLTLRRDSYLQAIKGITNINGQITGAANLKIVTGGTLANLSGKISATQNLELIANHIHNKTLVHPFTDKNGSGTRLGEIAGFNSEQGNIILKSYNDIIFEGANASANNGLITFNADGNISIVGIREEYQSSTREGDWEVNQSTLDIFQSRLTAKETISLIAGGAINITASELISTHGGIELLAGQGIHILDDLNQTQIQKIDRKGKTTGQSSEFRTEAVRAILSAGKGVLLDSEFGDVTLKAAEITSTSGTHVHARNGTVHLLMTKELEEFHLQTVRKGTWTIKTRTEDIVHENNIQNAIIGGLQVQAVHGINVEYTGKEGATLAEQIEEFRNMPELAWMAELYDQALAEGGQNLNWEAMEEIHKELKKTKRNLSPAAMAIIAICVAVAMGPAGAGLIGSGGSISSAVVAAGGNATLGAALSAGALTLTTQATQSLASGNNLRETISAFSENESLKSLAVSMVTAGAMQHTDLSIFEVAEGANPSIALANQAGQALVDATVRAGISVTINGGNSDDYLNAFNNSFITSAINFIGNNISEKISNAASFNEASKYIAHAAMGCLAGGLTNKVQDADIENGCSSGAGGAVIGHALTSDQVEQKLIEWGRDLESGYFDYGSISDKATYFRSLGIDLSKVVAAFAAYALGGDVNTAAGSAEIVAKANVYKAIDLLEVYRQLNGDFVISASTNQVDLITAKYVHDAVEIMRAKGIDPAVIDSLIEKMKAQKLFENVAKYDAAELGDGSDHEVQSHNKANGTFHGALGVTNVLPTIYVEADLTSSLTLDFLAGTNQVVTSLSPEEQQAAQYAFMAFTMSPMKLVIIMARNYGFDKLMPDALRELQNELTTNIGVAGVGFLYETGFDETKRIYVDQSDSANMYVSSEVDGLSWLVENITGLPGRPGTNTPTYIHKDNNDNQSIGYQVDVRVLPKDAPLRKDFDEHAVAGGKRDGKHIINSGRIDGAHNKKYFDEILEDPRQIPGDKVPAKMNPMRTPIEDKNGNVVGYSTGYQVPSVEKGGTVISRDRNGNVIYMKEKTKSVYDPDVLSDTEYLAASKRASQLGYDQKAEAFGNNGMKSASFDSIDPDTGLTFRVYISRDKGNELVVYGHLKSPSEE